MLTKLVTCLLGCFLKARHLLVDQGELTFLVPQNQHQDELLSQRFKDLLVGGSQFWESQKWRSQHLSVLCLDSKSEIRIYLHF
jgi:hypothetical protein